MLCPFCFILWKSSCIVIPAKNMHISLFARIPVYSHILYLVIDKNKAHDSNNARMVHSSAPCSMARKVDTRANDLPRLQHQPHSASPTSLFPETTRRDECPDSPPPKTQIEPGGKWSPKSWSPSSSGMVSLYSLPRQSCVPTSALPGRRPEVTTGAVIASLRRILN